MPTAADNSRLDYATDTQPGFTRIFSEGIARYRGRNGRLLTDRNVLARIASLAIPPAWTDVWICASAHGHLQATGRDARGRKQYRYHPAWTAERDSNKFDSLRAFAGVLPRIRRSVKRDLALAGVEKRRVLAAVVQLMDRTFIRVGGERYRRENGSFGATTLRTRHVRLSGPDVLFDFRGKSGKRQQLEITDPRLASVIRRCLDLPGQVLFQYRDTDDVRSISAADVNEYLRDIAGASVTSKDFRTWGGTLHAAAYLGRLACGDTRTLRRQQIREAIKAAARMLGNTPAVCRRSYVHPAVLASHEAGLCGVPSRVSGLRAGESALLGLLDREAAARPAAQRRRKTCDPAEARHASAQ